MERVEEAAVRNPMKPDPEEQSFAESLRDGIKELRGDRGVCPSSEELVGFFEGRLASADSSRVREHVEACGLCDAAIGRLEMPDSCQATGHLTVGRRMWIRLWNPIVGYGLASLLVYPAYLG